MVLAGAFTFGELASRYPQAGGLYVYLREAWGARVAFLYGWQSLLIMDPGLTAALAAGASQYVVVLWPAGAGFERWIAVGTIWIVAVLNMAGLTFGARVFGFLTALKLCTLAGIIVHRADDGGRQLVAFRDAGVSSASAPPIGEALALGAHQRVLLVRRLLGNEPHSGRDARPTPDAAAGAGPRRAERHRDLRDDHRRVHLPGAAGVGDERVRVCPTRGRGARSGPTGRRSWPASWCCPSSRARWPWSWSRRASTKP